MPHCAVVGCASESESLGEIVQTFPLPKSGKMRDLWIKQINRAHYTPSKSTRICKIHFPDYMFVPESENKDSRNRPRLKKRLKPMAYPVLHMKNEKPDKAAQKALIEMKIRNDIIKAREEQRLKQLELQEEDPLTIKTEEYPTIHSNSFSLQNGNEGQNVSIKSEYQSNEANNFVNPEDYLQINLVHDHGYPSDDSEPISVKTESFQTAYEGVCIKPTN